MWGRELRKTLTTWLPTKAGTRVAWQLGAKELELDKTLEELSDLSDLSDFMFVFCLDVPQMFVFCLDVPQMFVFCLDVPQIAESYRVFFIPFHALLGFMLVICL